MDTEKILKEIANAIYWDNGFSKDQTKMVSGILQGADSDKANVICEYLDIPKRHNRTAIRQVLIANNIHSL